MARERVARIRSRRRRAASRKRDLLAAVLRALSDPTRLAIYRRVAGARSPIRVREITAVFPVRQPTVSHHLRVLREAGLVTSRRRGPWSWIEAGGPGLPALRRAFAPTRPGRRGKDPR